MDQKGATNSILIKIHVPFMELGYTRLPPPLGIFCLNDFADFVFTPAPFTEKSSQNFPGVVYCQKIKIN